MKQHAEKTRGELLRYAWVCDKELSKRRTNFRVMFGSIVLNFIMIGFIIGALLP
ncbi:hypothetical protein GRI33_06145 [Brucella sp. BO3]|uniref:hypothetical protein n=1 Tax=unclassified Brucella TaxID=2632610 RepID=UPI0015B5476F|nr:MULTISPECIES: hypothetical protein [unclassified Brucella]QMV26530.1 hypothetical protein GRI33_06145 [Brucella sp. BO3]